MKNQNYIWELKSFKGLKLGVPGTICLWIEFGDAYIPSTFTAGLEMVGQQLTEYKSKHWYMGFRAIIKEWVSVAM